VAARQKILLLPLSNVLGHITRTLALAEEFDARGDEVHVVMCRAYASLRKALPPRINIHPAPEMFAMRTGPDAAVASYEGSAEADRVNAARSSRLSPSEKRRRGGRMSEMLARDATIIEQVRPDAIITDQRFTPALLPGIERERLFHVSNLLGYPTFVRRVSGAWPFPLDSGHILVAGVREIEYGRDPPAPAIPGRCESLCGMFRWAGWDRLNRDAAPPPASDVFLFFGSTGNSNRIVPWLLQQLPERYRVSGIATGTEDAPARRNAHVSPRGNLESFLARTEVALCHGGHVTVMECILHSVPMLIFPHNIEQLEIGRRVEQLGLGILVKRPYGQLDEPELGGLVEAVRTDDRIRANLERYSALLRRRDGAREAASIVHRSLAEA
jgi:UDP:flavonoid glycosyltransferase YjiC (YdhE family)